ncbi:hypothetical protein [Nocardioides dilutus]
MRATRRHTRAVGLLVGVLVLLMGALPALAWRLIDGRLTSDNTDGWAARERIARVSQGAPVRITGSTRRPVAPGTSSRIGLRFVATSSRTVVLHRVRVRIISIEAPNADATHPCSRADFRIRQMEPRMLQVPRGRVTTLWDLGVRRREWPRLTMINRPVNQDGCKGARLTLGYRARGARWP